MARCALTVQLPRVNRRGYSIIEFILVLVLLSIVAGMAIPKLSFLRYRQDAAGRYVQRTLITAQQISMRQPTNVLVIMDYAASRLRIVEDTNANGSADAAERMQSWKLPEGAKFAIPGTTVDGATAYYATGSGITSLTAGPTLTFYPSGSASGNAFIYLGVTSGRTDALRAIEFTGSTARTRLWRYLNGGWRRDSL